MQSGLMGRRHVRPLNVRARGLATPHNLRVDMDDFRVGREDARSYPAFASEFVNVFHALYEGGSMAAGLA